MNHDNVLAALSRARGGCRAHADGDCYWKDCPQKRDGEPEKTGRHCPLDHCFDEEGFYAEG